MKHEGGFTTAIPEARKQLWMDKIQPDNMQIAEMLTLGLSANLKEEEFVAFDYSRVGALQQNRNEAFVRATQAWQADWRTLNETRREVGDAPIPDGDVLYSEFKQRFVPAGTPDLKPEPKR